MDTFDVVFFCSLLRILQSCRYEPWKSMGAIFQIFWGRRIQKTEWDNIPNLLTQGWESRKLFCPVQLMLGLGSNGLLKFREKRKVRQASGKGEKEWSDKLFPFTFWCCLKLLFPLFTQCPLAGKYVTASPQSAVFYTRLDFGPGTRGWFNPVRWSCTGICAFLSCSDVYPCILIFLILYLLYGLREDQWI